MELPAFLPAPIARITVAEPVTMSPPPHTPGFVVFPVSESLVGRLFRFEVTPFSFSEFLQLFSAREEMIIRQKEIGDLWGHYFESLDLKTLWVRIQKISGELSLP